MFCKNILFFSLSIMLALPALAQDVYTSSQGDHVESTSGAVQACITNGTCYPHSAAVDRNADTNKPLEQIAQENLRSDKAIEADSSKQTK